MILLSFVLCVCGNTEMFPIYWDRGASPAACPDAIGLFGGFSTQITVDFHLNALQRPQEGPEERILLCLEDETVAGKSLRVSWSAVHPMDVDLKQISPNLIELRLKTNAYTPKSHDFAARIHISVVEISQFLDLAVYCVSILLVATSIAFLIINSL